MEEGLREKDVILDELRVTLLQAQQKMKVTADNYRREEAFEVGDLVCLKLQPYRQKFIAKRPDEKLSARFYGPFSVLKKNRLSSLSLSSSTKQ